MLERTSLVAQTAGHTRVAEVAHEAVARARLIPEDVRLVAPKVVADHGVVPEFRRSAEGQVRRDHDPARDMGGTGGDVAREVVARKLHVRRAEKRDADPRDIPLESPGSTRARIVLDRVGSHLEATNRFLRSVSFEEHASAVVVDRVCGEGASFRVGDVDAPRAAGDVVANDLQVRGFRAEDGDARITVTAYVVGDHLGAGRIEDNRADFGGVRDVVGEHLRAGRVKDERAEPVLFEIIVRDGRSGGLLDHDRALVPFGDVFDNVVHDIGVPRIASNNDPFGAGRLGVGYDVVLRDGGVDVPTKADRAGAVTHETVSHDGSVAGTGSLDSEGDVLRLLEAPEREAGNAHVAHARAGELAVL